MTSKKTYWIALFAILFINCSKPIYSEEKVNPERPNIIYILADDMGVYDLGCYGQQKIKTPNIDKMAAEGMLFTQHYAGSTVCAPSRGTLMTGYHTGHGYVKGNFAMPSEGNLPLPDKTITVAEKLKEAGYKTGIIGKWGLGGPSDEGHPNKQGFDYSFCYLDQRLAHEYYPDHLWWNYEKVMLDREYSHDLFAEESLDFIRKNKANPFFLYLPFTIPHGKYQVPDDEPYSNESWTEKQKNYAAMTTRMDKDIGRIFSLLDSLNLDENTIVFFASDNGGVKEISSFFGSQGPFRGYKTDCYEGGIRSPLIVRWPGKIEAGSKSDHVSAFWDFLPTACDLVGCKAPTEIDGISFLPALLNQDQEQHKLLYWEYFNYNYSWKPGSTNPRNYLLSEAIRVGDWKGVRKNLYKNPDADIELYNLKNDIGEENDVADQYPEIVKELTDLMLSEHNDSEYFKVNQH
ncbi:arylsulfatase [Maribellus mangrovi]|uniref:arylsulfatase n=1 Tax=Maribellus mangrovi TaxID=3133146 RepID=UPI0030EC766E